MYINFWYAATESASLAGTPRRLRMLGCDFVVFRDRHGVAHHAS